jgi:hypothetical protein
LTKHFVLSAHCRLEENERMDRREAAKQQQKHQMQMQMQQMQRQSQGDNNEAPHQPLFGVPKKVRTMAIGLKYAVDNLESTLRVLMI